MFDNRYPSGLSSDRIERDTYAKAHVVTGGTGVDSAESSMSRPPSQGSAITERDVQYLTKIKHRNDLDRKRREATRAKIDKLIKELIILL